MSWLIFNNYYGVEKSSSHYKLEDNDAYLNNFLGRFDQEMFKFMQKGDTEELDKKFLRVLLKSKLSFKIYPQGKIDDEILLYIYRVIALGDREGFSSISKEERWEKDWNQYSDKRRMMSLARQIPIWLVDEQDMPEANRGDYATEYYGYYDASTPKIVLCPKRIEEASDILKQKKDINITSKVLYAIVLISALTHAIMDNTNVLDSNGYLYAKVPDSRIYNTEYPSVANGLVLKYFDQAWHDGVKDFPTVRDFIMVQPLSYRIGISDYEIKHTDWRTIYKNGGQNLIGDLVPMDDNW